MEEEEPSSMGQPARAPHSSPLTNNPSASSISTSQVQQQQQENNERFLSGLQMRDDVWSCLAVLVVFWLFASMTLILGFYGSVNLHLGPSCSRLIKTNPFFVKSILAEEINDRPKPGLTLYGFYEAPELDVETTWTETRRVIVPIDFHKEWVYFLNKGSKVDIFYNVKSSSFLPLSLVIAQGRESLVEWINDPSNPNSTLSWNIIWGNGMIKQEILKSSNYYIAVGNLNSKDVKVELKFTVKAITYNTTQAYYKCSLGNRLCSLKLFLFGKNAAVLASPNHEGVSDDWYIKLSYGPRWITYLVGSGLMTVVILLAFRVCNTVRPLNGHSEQVGERGSEQVSLLPHKDDDISSWGSSFESISNDEEDLNEWLAVTSGDKAVAEGKIARHLCVICMDAERDCFFLPCGHCAACITCGTRIAEEASTCPICRRSIKKVRKIFAV